MESDDGPATPALPRAGQPTWTRGDGQRARQLVLRRVVFRFSRRKSKGALKCSIKVATVCAALRDAGLVVSQERISDLIMRFGSLPKRPISDPNVQDAEPDAQDTEPDAQDTELSHKTMGPLAYTDKRALGRKRANVAASASQPATKAGISFYVNLADRGTKGSSMPRAARSQVAHSTARRKEGPKPTKKRGEEPRMWPAGRVPYLAAESLLLSMLSDSALETLVQARARRCVSDHHTYRRYPTPPPKTQLTSHLTTQIGAYCWVFFLLLLVLLSVSIRLQLQ